MLHARRCSSSYEFWNHNTAEYNLGGFVFSELGGRAMAARRTRQGGMMTVTVTEMGSQLSDAAVSRVGAAIRRLAANRAKGAPLCAGMKYDEIVALLIREDNGGLRPTEIQVALGALEAQGKISVIKDEEHYLYTLVLKQD